MDDFESKDANMDVFEKEHKFKRSINTNNCLRHLSAARRIKI